MVKAENKYLQLFKSWQRLFFNIGLAALVLFFVVRPFMRKFRQVADAIRELPTQVPRLPGEQQTSPMLMVDDPVNQLSVRKQSTALVRQDPDKATEIIRQWLKDEVSEHGQAK